LPILLSSPHPFHRQLDGYMVHTVSLPREWIQESKCMITVNSTHGLFLTCTQKSHLYLHSIKVFNIHIMYKQLYLTLCKKTKRNPTYLERQLLASGDKVPSTLVPCLVTTALPLASTPFTPFPPRSPHYTIYNDDIHNHGLLCPGRIQVVK
jgi:hypothetical protein